MFKKHFFTFFIVIGLAVIALAIMKNNEVPFTATVGGEVAYTVDSVYSDGAWRKRYNFEVLDTERNEAVTAHMYADSKFMGCDLLTKGSLKDELKGKKILLKGMRYMGAYYIEFASLEGA